MKRLIMLFGDQLSRDMSSLADYQPDDVVLMCEVNQEITHVKHHQQKIIFVLSAMRHFAVELKKQAYQVDYVELDDKHNTGELTTELVRAVARHQPDRIIMTEPSEYRVMEMVRGWEKATGIPVEIRGDDRFLISPKAFAEWANGKRELRMETFYHHMRKKTGILMQKNNKPVGGAWNYDKENRESLREKPLMSSRSHTKPDAMTQSVIDLVGRHYATHVGEISSFNWAVTRRQALNRLNDFIENYLPDFGRYQDAMLEDEAFLFHSLLSPYLNIGLLLPMEVCKQAEQAYKDGKVPLNSAEGFIRQVLGWREFIRGMYWLHMPEYADKNALHAKRSLPALYWDAKTKMNCMHTVVKQTIEHAYSHHIQRLMITGNFALIAGLLPVEVCEWYLIVYADAFDWVELPNTLGMALHGDGGIIGSKPYAASGNYINKMSNFCDSCHYDVKQVIGENACPFNSFYWDFIHRNQESLGSNRRLIFAYSNWQKKSADDKKKILQQAADYFKLLEQDEL